MPIETLVLATAGVLALLIVAVTTVRMLRVVAESGVKITAEELKALAKIIRELFRRR
ncbi:hypothetical protein ACIRL0_36240 [Streptomyces sp. NPDC102365]|uniref:hypothetical protein n=1 Tax=Streptomyces sp. NPDC102365 TaxID=3366162 RepID=UPI00382553C0